MRPFRIAAVLAALLSTTAVAAAQSPPTDAARAVEAARAAAQAAEEAAQAAREAADAAERAQRAAMPPSERTTAELVSADERVEENLDVAASRRRRDAQLLSAGIARGVANGPNDRMLRSSLSPEMQLLASADDKVASLSWTLDFSGTPRPGTLSATQFTATVTSSLSGGEAEILGLRGFPGGTQITGNLTHFFTSFDATGSERNEVAVARDNCRLRRRGEANLDTVCNPYAYGGGVSRFVADYYPEGIEPMLESVFPSEVWFGGGGFSGNQANFAYLDQPSFSMQNVSRFGYSGNVFVGVIFGPGQTSVTGSFSYGRRYRARDPITLCQAINAIPQTQCITAPAGPPTRRNEAIASVELRHAFAAAVGEHADFAIAPEFSWDIENDAYSIDLPLYLVADAQDRLRGGVRFTWLNSRRETGGRDNDYALGIFVGVPFSIFR